MKRLLNRIICLILTVALTAVSVVFNVAAADENLARNLTAIASADGMEKAIDGDVNSVWKSNFTEGTESYIGVCADENKLFKFNTVVIREAETENGYGIKEYKIQTSNDLKVWTDIPEAAGVGIGKLQAELYLQQPLNVRAVRLLVTGSELSEFAVSEFEIYEYSENFVKEEEELDISYKYHDTLLKLKAFGIYENYSRNSFAFTSGLGRTDFLKLIAKLAGGEHDTFGDITENTDGIITYLKTVMSYNSKNDIDFSFLQSDTISYKEAAAALLAVGGYSRYANSMGNYPDGFAQLTLQKNLLKGIESGMDDTVTNGNFAIMISNLLEIQPVEIISIGSEITYGAIEDSTLLESLLGIYEFEGQVRGDEYSLLYGEGSLAENQIMIGEEVFTISNNSIGKWLGLYVDCWYRIDKNDEYNIAYIEENDRKFEKIRIDADDIISFSNNTYQYYKNNNRKESVSLDKSAYLLYNGKYFNDFDAEFFTPLTGEVELIDINNDGSYNVLRITAYENFVVESIDLTNNILYSKGYVSKPLNLNESDVTYEMFLENGAQITVAKLRPKDVLTVKQSQDKKLLSITVCRTKTEGVVTRTYTNDNGDLEITVNGKNYPVDKAYLKELQSMNMQINNSSQGVFYLDVFGRVATAELRKVGSNIIGFLTAAYESEEADGTFLFKIFDEEGQLKTYRLANSVIINNEKKVATRDNLFSWGIIESNGSTQRQLIAFSLNAEGEVKKIYTAVDPVDNKFKNAVLEKSLPAESTTYFSGQQRFRNFLIDNNTLILCVPSDDFVSSAGDRFFSIKTRSNYINEVGGYNMEAYNLDEVNYAPIVVEYISSGQGRIVETSGFLIVRKIITGMNNAGDVVKYIGGLENGEEVLYPVIDDSNLFDKLENGDCKLGDVLSISKNQNNEISNYEKIFDFSDVKKETNETSGKISFSVLSSSLRSSTNFYSNMQTLFGSVEAKKNDIVKINVNIRGNGETLYSHRMSTGSTFYVVDMKDKTVNVGSIYDIVDGDEDIAVFMRMKHTKTSEIVIYKNCSYGIE